MKYIFILTIAFLSFGFTHTKAQDSFLDFDRRSDTETLAKNIVVEGAQRIDPATIISYMDIKPGDKYTQSDLSFALKNLYDTGLFADVNVLQKKNDLVVTVLENPIINRVAFEGNSEIDDAELASEISTRPRGVYVRKQIRSDVDRINNLYRRSGRYSVEVTPKIIRLDQNRIDLAFEITEGEVSRIQGIKFVGNEIYDDEKLRAEISSKEDKWYRFISASDRYDPDRLSYDQELLRRFYLKNGYADFRILSANAELTSNKEDFFITVTVDEGERYKVSNVSVDASQLRDVSDDQLSDSITIKQNDWYSSEEINDSVDSLTSRLGDLQYAFAKITPDVQRNTEEKTLDIRFVAQQTPRVFVEAVDIKGNVRTLDRVVRREFEMVEGDPFSSTKLSESERKIRDLDFFSNVVVKPVPGSAPDQTIIEVDVEEKSTGEISVGAGFSTADGPLADFSIRERNFLGKGQDLLFATTLAGERTQFNISFTEPYFLDRDLSAGIDLVHTTRDLQDESSYSQKTSGLALRTEYPLSKHLRQAWKYRIENNEIEDIDAGASRFIRDQEGERLTSAIGQVLTYNRLDSNIIPTDGYKLWLDTELAGLGGDAKYISGKTGFSYYYPLAKKVTLNALGEVGAIASYSNADVEINERYFIGNRTLRGFEYGGLGPRDTVTDDALGGNTFYRGSLEAGFPLGLPEEIGVKGFAFTDFGSLFDLDESGAGISDSGSLRASVGVGLGWQSPLGPLRVDIAKAFLKEDYDEEEVFRFDFGTRF
jgi:outer membrane protein insertion porin family